MKLDIKTAIVIGTLLFTGAGFYYTTESRLKDAENEISFLHGQVRTLRTETKRLNKLVRNIRKGNINK